MRFESGFYRARFYLQQIYDHLDPAPPSAYHRIRAEARFWQNKSPVLELAVKPICSFGRFRRYLHFTENRQRFWTKRHPRSTVASHPLTLLMLPMMKTSSGKPANVANLCRRGSFLFPPGSRTGLKRTPLFISVQRESLIRRLAVNIGEERIARRRSDSPHPPQQGPAPPRSYAHSHRHRCAGQAGRHRSHRR